MAANLSVGPFPLSAFDDESWSRSSSCDAEHAMLLNQHQRASSVAFSDIVIGFMARTVTGAAVSSAHAACVERNDLIACAADTWLPPAHTAAGRHIALDVLLLHDCGLRPAEHRELPM